jgi:ferritin
MGCIAAKYMDQILFWWKLYHSKFTLLLFSCVSPYFTFKNDDVHGLSTHTQTHTHTHTNEEACHKIYIYIYIYMTGTRKKIKKSIKPRKPGNK